MSNTDSLEHGRDQGFRVTMTTRQWQIIDATIDNEVDMAVTNGDPQQHVAELGRSIRQAGWDQLIGADGEWPPVDEVVSVTLSGPQWELVTESLENWASVSDDLGQHDDAQRGRLIRTLVKGQLPR
ncbi:hypothetical protein [Micromonospora sp. KC723]|uniref:hypothetical protein n=1 Tax=Micromonospora sp. KC723 TaxID=2530381 RepID=UPI00104F5D5A|nr:hypothetical protein [Micromonospora sp. KC723]TDB73611.1 hypothetical protein E1165_16770 [Micromonospora sp. KC723]